MFDALLLLLLLLLLEDEEEEKWRRMDGDAERTRLAGEPGASDNEDVSLSAWCDVAVLLLLLL